MERLKLDFVRIFIAVLFVTMVFGISNGKTMAADSKATVSINGNNLGVGANTVSIVVKAENGATKIYTITVNRKQDPNYVASTDSSLQTLSVSAGVLSPEFSADITEYVVYVPYETANITAQYLKQKTRKKLWKKLQWKKWKKQPPQKLQQIKPQRKQQRIVEMWYLA